MIVGDHRSRPKCGSSVHVHGLGSRTVLVCGPISRATLFDVSPCGKVQLFAAQPSLTRQRGALRLIDHEPGAECQPRSTHGFRGRKGLSDGGLDEGQLCFQHPTQVFADPDRCKGRQYDGLDIDKLR